MVGERDGSGVGGAPIVSGVGEAAGAGDGAAGAGDAAAAGLAAASAGADGTTGTVVGVSCPNPGMLWREIRNTVPAARTPSTSNAASAARIGPRLRLRAGAVKTPSGRSGWPAGAERRPVERGGNGSTPADSSVRGRGGAGRRWPDVGSGSDGPSGPKSSPGLPLQK